MRITLSLSRICKWTCVKPLHWSCLNSFQKWFLFEIYCVNAHILGHKGQVLECKDLFYKNVFAESKLSVHFFCNEIVELWNLKAMLHETICNDAWLQGNIIGTILKQCWNNAVSIRNRLSQQCWKDVLRWKNWMRIAPPSCFPSMKYSRGFSPNISLNDE